MPCRVFGKGWWLLVEAGPVSVIDDDPSVRALTAQILADSGIPTQSFRSAAEFLASNAPQLSACVVTDLRMPEMDGAELLGRLRSDGNVVSVVFVTGFADIRTAVRLMADGALSLLEKPYNPDELVQVVRVAMERTEKQRDERRIVLDAQRRFGQLSDESRSVAECMLAGMSNKLIVSKLDISPRTLDRRKQMVFATLGVSTVSELIALASRAGVSGVHSLPLAE
ncbi:MAG: hypothetical protein C0483_26045 [Pirellula sp.]|nr:hypothetical protein [Pirellula sp.]